MTPPPCETPQVFRFPSTFTFIFRAFASVDGIGKGLDPKFDIPKAAQPFINELTEADAGSEFDKWSGRLSKATGVHPLRPLRPCYIRVTSVLHPCYVRVTSVLHPCYTRATSVLHPCYIRAASVLHPLHPSRLSKATGLNAEDIDIAVRQPQKVAYLERTLRSMEQGALKIRVRSLENEQLHPLHPLHPLQVRSLENEQALARLALGQAVTNKLLVASLFLNLGLARVGAVPAFVWLAAAGAFGAQARSPSCCSWHGGSFLSHHRYRLALAWSPPSPRHHPPHHLPHHPPHHRPLTTTGRQQCTRHQDFRQEGRALRDEGF